MEFVSIAISREKNKILKGNEQLKREKSEIIHCLRWFRNGKNFLLPVAINWTQKTVIAKLLPFHYNWRKKLFYTSFAGVFL